MKNHLQFKIQRGGFIEIERICQDTCDTNFHSLVLSEKLLRIIGFENRNLENLRIQLLAKDLLTLLVVYHQ